MNIKLIVLLNLLIITSSTNEAPEGQRLIKLNPNEPAKWMTNDEVIQLRHNTGARIVNLIDVTDSGDVKLASKMRIEYIYPNRSLQQTVVCKLFSHIQKGRLKETVQKLSSFYNRHDQSRSGPDEAESWLETEIRSSLAAYSGDSGLLEKVGSSTGLYNQHNLLARLEGHDSNLKDEIIILGAHYDSRAGLDGQGRAPGADDNASGCAVLLEVLRLIAQFRIKFKHSVELHWYTAKESSSLPLGSWNVATKYRDEKKAKVKGMLNLDSIGFQSPSFGKAIGVVDSFNWNGLLVACPSLTAFVKMLIKEYVQNEYVITNVDCNRTDWCVSDNFFWHEKGYPWAFVTEVELSPHRNSELDTLETVDFEQVNEFAKLALAYVIELGELSEIPEIPDTTTAVSSSEQPHVGCAHVLICNIILLTVTSRISQ